MLLPHCRNLQDSAPNFNENLEGGYFDSSYSRNHFEKGSYMDITKIKNRLGDQLDNLANITVIHQHCY